MLSNEMDQLKFEATTVPEAMEYLDDLFCCSDPRSDSFRAWLTIRRLLKSHQVITYSGGGGGIGIA